MSGSVYTVASGKGGVGKTTTTVNLGVAVWQEGNSVAVVDADLGMANLSAVLGLDPERTLHDVLAGETILEEAIVEAKGGDLLVLPGSRELAGFAAANPQKLKDVLENLAARCDYVIVDTGAGLGYEDVLPLGLADAVILVSSADPASLGDTRKTAELAALVETPVLGAVVTRTVEGTDSEAIAAEIGAELLGTVPEDPSVMEATVAGDPLASHAPNADATAAYMELGRTVLGAEIPAVPEPSDDELESTAPESDEPTSPEGDEEGPEAVDAVTEGDESADDDEAAVEADEPVEADEEPVDEPEPSPEEAAADESEPAADETSGPVPADGAEAADSSEPHAEGKTDADAPEEASPAPGAAEDDTDADEPAPASGGTDEPEPAADDSEEAADESADAEPAEDESGDDEPVEDESVDDAPADEATADAGSAESGPGDEDGDGDEDTQDPSGGRSGGLRGWLGRLFS